MDVIDEACTGEVVYVLAVALCFRAVPARYERRAPLPSFQPMAAVTLTDVHLVFLKDRWMVLGGT